MDAQERYEAAVEGLQPETLEALQRAERESALLSLEGIATVIELLKEDEAIAAAKQYDNVFYLDRGRE